jgi:asparagine synthase (glutamine-hydrolysing)
VDHDLVDKLFPLPDDLRIRGSRQKWVLREAVRERLTPAHFTAPKRGFVGPTASWLRNELRQVLTDELSTARLERLGLFEPAMVERLLREHFDRTANHEGVLWGLLVFSIWHRQMVETPHPT